MLAVFVYSMNSLLYLLLGRQRHYETCQCQHYWLDIHQAVNSQHKMTMKIISTHNICLWNGSEHNLIRRESHYMRLSSFEIAVNWYFFSLFFATFATVRFHVSTETSPLLFIVYKNNSAENLQKLLWIFLFVQHFSAVFISGFCLVCWWSKLRIISTANHREVEEKSIKFSPCLPSTRCWFSATQ